MESSDFLKNLFFIICKERIRENSTNYNMIVTIYLTIDI